MISLHGATAPYKVELRLMKQTPGEPDAETVVASWYDTDGTEITDPVRIAALERKAQEVSDANR